jgi:hypothetical protein
MDSPARAPEPPLYRERAERNLGAIVVTIEFTLISVMVGVILFPLMDYATPLLRELKFEYWLYILSGLVFILFLWTLVISHALTFVGWPIDLGHNLLYIALSLVFAIQMHFLAEPLAWWLLTIASALVGAVLTWYDKQLIEKRLVGARGTAVGLYKTALNTQRAIFRRFPIFLGFSIGAAVGILLVPQFFIALKGHVILIAIQILINVVSLQRSLRGFACSTPAILEKEIEALDTEHV